MLLLLLCAARLPRRAARHVLFCWWGCNCGPSKTKTDAVRLSHLSSGSPLSPLDTPLLSARRAVLLLLAEVVVVCVLSARALRTAARCCNVAATRKAALLFKLPARGGQRKKHHKKTFVVGWWWCGSFLLGNSSEGGRGGWCQAPCGESGSKARARARAVHAALLSSSSPKGGACFFEAQRLRGGERASRSQKLSPLRRCGLYLCCVCCEPLLAPI